MRIKDAMATPLLARTIRVVIKAHRDTEQRANVLHVQVDGLAVQTADVINAASWITGWVADRYLPMASDQVVFDEVVATDVSIHNGFQITSTLAQQPGQLTAEPALPGNVCLVATEHTAQGGRQGRGRMFLFDTPVNTIQNGERYLPGHVAAVALNLNQLLTPPPAAPNLHLAVGSPKGLCSFAVTSIIPHDYIGNQKDRLPGHRRHKKHRVTP